MLTKKQGNVSAYVMFYIAISAAFIYLIFNPLINVRVMVTNQEGRVQQRYNEMAGLERIISIYKENISYSLASASYEDLSVSWAIAEKARSESVVSDSQSLISDASFLYTIENATDVNIEVEVISCQADGYYDIVFKAPGDTIIISESVLINDGAWSVQAADIYDVATDTIGYGYGEYTLSLIVYNAEVSLSVTYTDILQREMEVTHGNKKFVLRVDKVTGSDNIISINR